MRSEEKPLDRTARGEYTINRPVGIFWRGGTAVAAKGNATRQKILEKAIQLFSVKGYFHTSIADIVEASDLSKGGLYGHFRSKEEIWYAAYDECTRIWKEMVLKGVREIPDPLVRIRKVIENSMKDYLGAGIFEGGCLMVNSLVEFSRQSSAMNQHILKGFKGFSELLLSWLREAERKGQLMDGLDLRETASFLTTALNGAAPLYASSKDPAVWRSTVSQLHLFIDLLRKRV